MNKQDLDALANLYGEVYYLQDAEQLNEIAVPPKDPAASRAQSASVPRIIKRIARGSINALRDLPAATMSQLQGQGAIASNDAALRRQQIRGQNLEKLLSGKLDQQKSPVNPQRQGPPGANSPPPRPTATTPAPRPTATTPAPRPTATTPAPRPTATTPAPRPSGGGSLSSPRVAQTSPTKPAASSSNDSSMSNMAKWAKANPSLAMKVKPGQSGYSDIRGQLDKMSFETKPSPLAKSTAVNPSSSSSFQGQKPANVSAFNSTPTAASAAQPKPKPNYLTHPGGIMSSYEWTSNKKLKDLSGAYSSIYEAKKKVDQDADGDNDFADVRIARMIASGVPKEVAIQRVKNKSYNEEFELDEATRMRKELGKEGEIATRKELAARSRAHQRSGSVDRTIAKAERGSNNPYIKHKRNESDSDRNKRLQTQSRTLRGLAASRRGSVRDKPRAGMRGYASKVEGSDKELQSARQRAMSAGTLTPAEKKKLGEAYELVASYLLENNFAETLNDANVVIENMSEAWVTQILSDN